MPVWLHWHWTALGELELFMAAGGFSVGTNTRPNPQDPAFGFQHARVSVDLECHVT